MTDDTCRAIGGLLVEYADGELLQPDAKGVATHLARCPGCRAELDRLRRSLELAQAIWHEAAAGAALPATVRSRPTRRPIAVAACVAACVAASLVVLAGMLGEWPISPGQPRAQVEQPAESRPQSEPQPTQAASPSESMDLEGVDLEAFIAREGRRARLAASARLLASRPELKHYQDQAERYLARAFPDSNPATVPRAPDDSSPNPKEPES